MAEKNLEPFPLLQSQDQCEFVYFKLETSGFERSADILQIAAISSSQDSSFSIFVNPTQPIGNKASEKNNLKIINGELHRYGVKVDVISQKDALVAFKQFLISLSRPCILVAHKVSFHSHFLVRAIQRHTMMPEFENLIVGFSDSLNILQNEIPNRKGTDQFKLRQLAQDFLGITNLKEEKMNNPIIDVEVLVKILTSHQISEDKLYEQATSLKNVLSDVEKSNNKKILKNTLTPLKNVITDYMIKKIAEAGISYDKLKGTFLDKGEDAVMDLLSQEGPDQKVLVTKDKKIVRKIVEFLKENACD